MYIKARSYAIINKTAFWFASLFSILVIGWPSLSIFAGDFGYQIEFLKSSIVQTSVTAMAALSFAFYSHYKKRQMMAENLMRLLITTKPDEAHDFLKKIMIEIERIDNGFTFLDHAKKTS